MKITIPKELVKKIEQRIKQTDFNSVEEYIVYVLEQMTDTDSSETESYSKEEEAALKQNLKDMGYI